AVKAKDFDAAVAALKAAFSEWDKAKKKNVIHKNAAANQKARLSKKVAAMSK
ncbi:MAG: 30S ribosomal protein S20, partial [Elusimicrobia bacterium]|nr:30S ribosomal protein S20 [Elusimicrobiota bacterium]